MLLFFTGDDENLAQFVINHGATVNDTNNKNETPLHFAAIKGF